jgi:hypothetical protein
LLDLQAFELPKDLAPGGGLSQGPLEKRFALVHQTIEEDEADPRFGLPEVLQEIEAGRPFPSSATISPSRIVACGRYVECCAWT